MDSLVEGSNRKVLGMDKLGRPRKDTEERLASLRRLLPGLQKGAFSKGEAARALRISHRSLNRYLERLEEGRGS